jgi:FkbM family methyltransferase
VTELDPEARGALFDGAELYADYLGVQTRNGRFVVSTSDQAIGRSLFVKEGRPEFRVLERAVGVIEVLLGPQALPGSQFVDVGANIGTTTVAALTAHRFGSAVACEPEEENHRLLRVNVALNGLETHVRTLRAGVSNRTGRAEFVVRGHAEGRSFVADNRDDLRAEEERLAAKAAADPGFELPVLSVTEVELVTLDSLAASGIVDAERVGLLWIDAEGHEGHVLEGASRLTERGVPVVFEFHPEGLDERGHRDTINAVAAESYTHFFDVRRQQVDRSQSRYEMRPTSELPAYAERFLDPEVPGYFTDLLLVRLDAKQAATGARLHELIHQTD